MEDRVLDAGILDARILVLNPGSSTLKWAVYGNDLALRESGVEDHPASLTEAAESVVRAQIARHAPVAVGCRVVQGADRFVEPTRVTPDVLAGIRALAPLAPLHNPPAADVLEACLRLLPDIPVIAVFDTAFHRTLPAVARTYALPRDLCERHGLRRFGFHGIAHRAVFEALRARAPASRCVTCHLGSGASACAIRDGESIDTSMGLTPLEGLVMATRSGDVDPGLLLYLLREIGLTPEALDDLLNRRSGLLGISGRSGDLRDLLQAASAGDAASDLALDIFAYRVAKTVGAYAAALEGLDALAFSGGIGENSPEMRRRICRRLGFLGLALDPAQNAAATGPAEPSPISTNDSRVQVWVVPADESRQIAREVRERL